MAATLRDVAQLAGVSFRTVSNVVNGHQYVSDATRSKVEAAIAQLGYQPNYSARSLRLGRSNLLGLAVPTLTQGYFAELASEIIDTARERGFTVLTEQTNSSRELELDALQGARRQLTDGLLINPISLGDDDIAAFETGRPVVLLGENVFSSAIDHVTSRNVDAAQAGTEFLLGLGHRRIAFIGRPEEGGASVGTAALRVEGYRRGLTAQGIAPDPRLEFPAGSWRHRDGAAAVRALLDGDISFDAVFAVTDILAMGALHELQVAGIRVPHEVSVLGFDDLVDGRYTNPTLSTIDGGRRHIASVAVDVLLQRIESPDTPTAFREVDFALIERDSTRRRG